MGSQKPETQSSPSSKSSNSKSYGNVILTLKNCLLPEEKLSPTPSQLDGLDKETEIDLRILGCELIQTAGILLKLPQVAMATGQVLFQRFYYSKSFVRHAMETTAMGCVCLASKIEEAPRRIRDVINVFHHIKQMKSQKTITPMALDQAYTILKNQVIKAERRVLKELGFCVHVKHPHKLIVVYLQVLNYEKHQSFMQLSWNYMNDSLRTDVFLRYQPETVACACIYLTARKLQIALPKNPSWFSLFRVSERDIQDVCLRILRLYERPKPNAEELDKRVDILKKQYEDARQKARQTVPSNNNSNNDQHSATDPNTPDGPDSPDSQPHLRSRPSSPIKSKDGKHHRSSGWPNNTGRNHHNDKHRSRSRSRSASRSPKRNKRSKKSRKSHSQSRSRTRSRSRSRSQSRDKRSKKNHRKSRRSSYSRSPSPSPRGKREKRYKSRSRSPALRHSRSRSYERSDKYYSDKKSRLHV